jgi:hypothetical protein
VRGERIRVGEKERGREGESKKAGKKKRGLLWSDRRCVTSRVVSLSIETSTQVWIDHR